MSLFYHVANVAVKALLMVLTRWRVEGRENVPRTGPLIVVSNHLTYIDPPLLGASIPRKIHFMAKEELFDSLRWRVLVEAYGAFPVKRGQMNREALRRATGALENGWVLGVFPEGKRSPDHRLQEPLPGASLLAAVSRALILPVGISGTENVHGIGFFLRRPRVTVRIGPPFQLPIDGEKRTRARLAQYSESIMSHIAEVLPESYRGDYGRGGDAENDDRD
jgi:1-acyl-sn-glycerol-3-phosphate acyltransferase